MKKININDAQIKAIKERIEKSNGRAVFAYIDGVSASGMSRCISFHIQMDNFHIWQLNSDIIAAGCGNWSNRDKVRIRGCGMDMIFHTLECFYQCLGFDYHDANTYAGHCQRI